MAGITLAQAEAKLAEYLAAETAVLAGQEYVIDGDRYRYADLERIQTGIDTWNARAQKLSRGGRLQVREVIPR